MVMQRVRVITHENFSTLPIFLKIFNVIKTLRKEQVSRKCSYLFPSILKRARLELPPVYRSALISFLKELPSVDVVKTKKGYKVVVYK